MRNFAVGIGTPDPGNVAWPLSLGKDPFPVASRLRLAGNGRGRHWRRVERSFRSRDGWRDHNWRTARALPSGWRHGQPPRVGHLPQERLHRDRLVGSPGLGCHRQHAEHGNPGHLRANLVSHISRRIRLILSWSGRKPSSRGGAISSDGRHLGKRRTLFPWKQSRHGLARVSVFRGARPSCAGSAIKRSCQWILTTPKSHRLGQSRAAEIRRIVTSGSRE